ncbi:MAG: hypothetical protein ACQETH_02980 [Candidatus Rifleibacteriota bacterium]
MSFIKRRGELSFEAIFALALFAIVLTTLMAVYRFHYSQNPHTPDSENIISIYDMILTSIRNDTRVADKASTKENGLDLYKNDQLVSSYNFMNGNLYRTEADGKGTILISSLEQASFKQHPELDRLLMVTLLPSDNSQIPFFTSFALRGGSLD